MNASKAKGSSKSRKPSGGGTAARRSATVVLSGGAPNSTLMTGAMAGIHASGKRFDNYYTSGAGAIVALMYLAPRNMTPEQAMEFAVNCSIADPIWERFQIPYKSFFKPGPFTVPMMMAAQMLKLSGDTPYTRLHNDTIDFWAAAMTPSPTTPWSKGLCAPMPFLAEAIDFDKLREMPGQLYMNAYNLTTRKMEEFGKHEIDVDHVWAALAFPFVYEPVSITREIDGEEQTHYFSEGSDRDPINLPRLHRQVSRGGIEADTTVVLIDVLGSLERGLVRVPRNLADAYSISILTPIVSLALKNKAHFMDLYQESDKDILAERGIVRPRGWKPAFRHYIELNFDIPEEMMPHLSDWSHSNMSGLYRIGVEAGKRFVDRYGDLLPDLQ